MNLGPGSVYQRGLVSGRQGSMRCNSAANADDEASSAHTATLTAAPPFLTYDDRYSSARNWA